MRNKPKLKWRLFFQNVYGKIEGNSIPGTNQHCRIWTGPKTRNGKYGLIGYRDPIDHRWKKKKAHRVSYMVSIIANMDLTSNMDCSHLCHNSLFVHINNNRQYCKNSNLCYRHAGYPDCLLHLKII